MISTHMVGTWMSEGITKGFSVWIGMTRAKSETHAVYAIRFFWFNQRQEHVGAARQWSAMYLLPVPAGGRKAVGTTGSTVAATFSAASIFVTYTKPWFSTKKLTSTLCCHRACCCLVWMRQAWHSSHPWLDSDRFSLPLVLFISEYTSHVSATRGRGRLGWPFSTRSCCKKEKLRGCAVT